MKRLVLFVVAALVMMVGATFCSFAGTKPTDFQRIVFDDHVFKTEDGSFRQLSSTPFRLEAPTADQLFAETVCIPEPVVQLYNMSGGSIRFVDKPFFVTWNNMQLGGYCLYDTWDIQVSVEAPWLDGGGVSNIMEIRDAARRFTHETGHFLHHRTMSLWTDTERQALRELCAYYEGDGTFARLRAEGYSEDELDDEAFAIAFETWFGHGESVIPTEEQVALPSSSKALMDYCTVLSNYIMITAG